MRVDAGCGHKCGCWLVGQWSGEGAGGERGDLHHCLLTCAVGGSGPVGNWTNIFISSICFEFQVASRGTGKANESGTAEMSSSRNITGQETLRLPGYRSVAGLDHAGRNRELGPWGEDLAVDKVLEPEFQLLWGFRAVIAEARP